MTKEENSEPVKSYTITVKVITQSEKEQLIKRIYPSPVASLFSEGDTLIQGQMADLYAEWDGAPYYQGTSIDRFGSFEVVCFWI